MDLKLSSQLANAYTSNSQKIRVLSEAWVKQFIFCPNCGKCSIQQHKNNSPAADFYCVDCNEDYELKSKNGVLGSKIVDGHYQTMAAKVAQGVNPNFFFMTYDKASLSVDNLLIIPKHYFTQSTIEKRKPLSSTARRAGWVGCNLLLNEIPSSGKIFVVKNRIVRAKDDVLKDWSKTLFLNNNEASRKGWIIEVIKIIEKIGKPVFSLNELYFFEKVLAEKYPKNNHIKPKIRQQLQILREENFLEFLNNGVYRLVL